MKQIHRFKLSALAVATTLACSPAAFATNGYFVHGYGTQSNGMAGVAEALPQDAIINATNPSGMTWLDGSRVDVGVALFNPIRDGSLNAASLGGANVENDSGATLFLIPNAGFKMDLAGNVSVGFTMYANGGMNTRYNSNTYFNALAGAVPQFVLKYQGAYASASDKNAIAAVGAGIASNPSASSTLGVNLAQLILAPSVSTKIGTSNSVGASLLVGYQRFRSYGLGLFTAFTAPSTQGNVTNQGDDDAWGTGLRLGWTGKLSDTLMVGASASSKIYMQKFSKYKGLFADNGAFDIPANYGLGLSFKPNSDWTFGFDVQRILYGGVPAIANSGPTANQFFAGLGSALTSQTTGAWNLGGGNTGTGPLTCANQGVTGCQVLGTSSGYGFGWKDQTIYKLGAAYKYNDQWTLRAGFNYGKSPIDPDQNLFNIVAPGVVEKHATLGFSYAPSKSNELSVAYMHAFRKDQSYTYTGTGGFNGYNFGTNIGMSQNALEASYSLKF